MRLENEKKCEWKFLLISRDHVGSQHCGIKTFPPRKNQHWTLKIIEDGAVKNQKNESKRNKKSCERNYLAVVNGMGKEHSVDIIKSTNQQGFPSAKKE